MEMTNIKESRNIIEDVVLGSIADELGVDPGDTLVSINGKVVKDVIGVILQSCSCGSHGGPRSN